VLTCSAVRDGFHYKFWVYILVSRTGTLYIGNPGTDGAFTDLFLRCLRVRHLSRLFFRSRTRGSILRAFCEG